MTIPQIISLVGATGLLSAFLNQFASLYFSSRTTKRKGKYAAIKLSVLLDKFALDCAEIMQDIDNAHSSGGHVGHFHTDLPEFKEYPKEIDWESLDARLAFDVLSFSNEVTIRNRAIDGYMEYVDDEGGPTECGKHCAMQGARALDISRRLCERYNVDSSDYMNKVWDVSKYLETEKLRYEKQEKDMLESQQKAMAEAPAK